MSTGAAATTPGVATRHAPAAVGVAWTLLVIDTLGSQGSQTVVPIPRPVIQMATFGSVLVAFAIALMLNPRLQVRRSAYLFLLTLLVIESIGASAQLESGIGAFVRCARFSCFVVTLWLLSAWWFDARALVRTHVRALCGVLLTVVVGLFVAPGLALPADNSGRLTGAVWPLSPPQVGQFAAIAIGLTVVLWMTRRTDGRSVVYIAVPATAVLLLTHTRTAALGLIVGLLVAGLSMVLTNSRARRTMTRAILATALGAAAFGQVIQAWVLRGQDQENFANLTGRAKVWDALLARPRTFSEKYFGVGLTDKSFNGLPIDSSWLAAYHEQGLFGVTVLVLILLTLIIVAVLRPPSANRALAIFLITYCLVASYTEASMTDASPYLLYLTLAAGLLSPGSNPDPDPAPADPAGASTTGERCTE